MKLRTAGVAAGAAVALLLPAAPAPAAESDGCFVGSPNIVPDVTDCVTYVLGAPGGCFIGSPNIVRDVTDCAAYVVDYLTR
jgi:hypothetical protein